MVAISRVRWQGPRRPIETGLSAWVLECLLLEPCHVARDQEIAQSGRQGDELGRAESLIFSARLPYMDAIRRSMVNASGAQMERTILSLQTRFCISQFPSLTQIACAHAFPVIAAVKRRLLPYIRPSRAAHSVGCWPW